MAGIARFFRRHFDSAADLDLHTKDDATDATAAAAGSAPTTPPSACQAHRLRTQSLDDEFGELPDVLLSHDDFPASPDSVLSTPQFEDAHQDLHKCEPQPREMTVAAAAAAVIAAAANASARSLSPSFAASSVPPAAAPPPPPLPPPTILSAATSAKPVKAPRRSSSSSSSLLPFIIPFATAVAFGGGGAGETTPAVQSSLQNAFTSTDQAGRQRSDSKHQHTPSLNFDGDGHLLGSAFPDLLERSAAVSSDDADDDTGAGAGAGNAGLLLDDYALFDLLGDSDPAVMDMFSHVVAALEAITRDGGALTSAQGTPQAARARASARSSPSSPPPVDKVAECTGGVYVLGNNDAVFKPRCEEAMHPPLPQMRPLAIGEPNPLRRGFQVGDGAAREVAAYQLDRAAGHFARVPPTTLVSVRSDVTSGTDGAVARTGAPRLEGSLQKYMTNSGSSEDYGSSTFGLERVQAIALLDVRLFNTDRHGGNLLVTDDGGGEDEAGACKKGLVPIDHGLCLPDFQHLGEFEAEWLFWREARAPLLPAARAHVAALDDDRDAALLRGLGFRAQSVLTLRLLTRFLKFTALELDWTLHDIGAFLTRSHLTPTQPTLTTQQHDGHGARSKFQALLGRAADAAVAAGGDTSLPGFLRGDVPFSDERARHLLAAAERQWRLELSEEA